MAANADELYRTMFRTMHGKRDMTMEEMQGPMWGKRPEESSRSGIAADQVAKWESASFGKRDQAETKSPEKTA